MYMNVAYGKQRGGVYEFVVPREETCLVWDLLLTACNSAHLV